MSWEQQGAKGFTKRNALRYERNFGLGNLDQDVEIEDLHRFLDLAEFEQKKGYKNMATQLINEQSREIIQLHDKEYITPFQYEQMENVLRNFYKLQGRNERIKKFPFPRDYSSMSNFFVWTFIFLLPFSLVPELLSLSHDIYFWMSIPVATLIGLIYLIMEDLGD